MESLEQGLQKISIATAAAVSDIPAPTADEVVVAIPVLRSPGPPQADSSAIPTMGRTDTVEAGSRTMPEIVLSPTEGATQGASVPPVASEDSSNQVEEIQQQGSNNTAYPGRSKVSPNSTDMVPERKLNSAVADNVQVTSANDGGKQLTSNRQQSRSPSPGRKRIPLVLSVDELFTAITTGNKKVVLQVMQSGVKITATAPDGTMPLQLAVALNQEEIVLTFLFFGADPNAGGGPEVSPLIAAIGHGHSRLVKILLEAGADPSVTGVMWKAATHSVEMVRLCIAKYAGFDYPIDINAFNVTGPHAINGETPLSVACNLGKVDVARFLLEEAKADAAVVFKGQCVPQFRSALHASIVRKDETLISLILAHLPDPNLCNDPRYEPGLLHCAIHTGKLSILQLLVDAGVNLIVSFRCGTALQEACGRGSLEMVEYLLQHHADPNIGPPDLHPVVDVRCPLHVAITHGSIPMVNALLAAGADPELHKGTLWLAAQNGNIEMVRRLLEIEGLDKNALASDVWNYSAIRGTALHTAAEKGHADVLKLLLEEGADPNVRTGHLGTPLDVAIRNKHQRCINILLGEDSDHDDAF